MEYRLSEDARRGKYGGRRHETPTVSLRQAGLHTYDVYQTSLWEYEMLLMGK